MLRLKRVNKENWWRHVIANEGNQTRSNCEYAGLLRFTRNDAVGCCNGAMGCLPQHVIANGVKQTRSNCEYAGLVTFGAPFGARFTRNDAMGCCNDVQRFRRDGARPVPTNVRRNGGNIILYHINQINHSSEKSKIK
jgi:hypothetical protein